MEKIPVFLPHIDKEMRKHLENALDVGWLGMGASTKEFETRISKFLNLKQRYVICTNTGTSSLHLALKIAGIGSGDEVITPSFNYVADHQAIEMTGAKVVMCDIKENNLGIDCKKAELLITKKTKAIMPLHFAGIICDLKEVYELAKKYNLRVIEDATHAFGTTVNQKKIGSYGDIVCFSFDPVKIITSIDGGCIVVNNKKELEVGQHYRLLGVDKDTTERYKNKRSWDYDVVSEGYRYHLTNIMSSVGISQIKQINKFIKNRQEICKKYNEAFKEIEEIKIPQTDFENISPFIYTIRILNGKREQLIQYLQDKKIEVGIHFIPVHKHSYFKNRKIGDMMITNIVVNEILTIPLHSNMEDEFVERIINAITSFFK
jgi:dTDP-4-amino-4,6-dideoxygalactose transaminase